MMAADGCGRAPDLVEGRCQTRTISRNTSENCARRRNSVAARSSLAGFAPEVEQPTNTPEDEVWIRRLGEAGRGCVLLAAEPVQ